MSAGLTLGVVVGVLIVAVLILAFVLGARRKDREPVPDRSPHSPERESWSTPPSTPGHAPLGDSANPEHLKFRR
ncbi:hypothetical protein EDD99_3470 [Streptomyces sp. 846.5]|jgi:hypothetical protein|nr:DUF6479 family protein [Streptomyces sp. 846.5]TDU04987.1 hypothetical protein EDD99_3470 [Streptomyces sp. 846.5]